MLLAVVADDIIYYYMPGKEEQKAESAECGIAWRGANKHMHMHTVVRRVYNGKRYKSK